MRGRVPAVDGLRGCAFLLVFLYHAGLRCPMDSGVMLAKLYRRAASYGFCGVDLFFVLSGFLISGILLETRGRDHGYRRFYRGRILRILPLFFLILVLAFMLLKPLLASQPSYAWLAGHQVWFWGGLQNWLYALRPYPAANLLGHLWSLAVEEQFYLFWPLLFLVFSGRAMLRISVGLAILALLLRGFAVGLMPARAASEFCYYATFTRLDGLAIGAIFGLSTRRNLRIGWQPFGILMVAATLVFDSPRWLHTRVLLDTLGTTLNALAFAALLAAATTLPADHSLVRALSWRVLRWIGRISYGLYLFSWPVMILLGSRWAAPTGGSSLTPLRHFAFLTGSLLVTLSLAVPVWYLLEKPLIHLGKR